MRKTRAAWLAACVALGLALPAAALARDQIRVVGSSTVYPFATLVAEEFGRTTPYRTPIVESTGSGGGLKLFCGGLGVQHPDITNASRRIKRSEVELCARNGVREITEIQIGYDGIVVASSKQGTPRDFTLGQIWLALAKQVPSPGGGLVDNPYQRWREIDPGLPDTPIEVLGPPPTSGTRDAFNELALEAGCRSLPEVAALEKTDETRFKAICHGVREDGAYVDAGENDNLIVRKLLANPDAFGVFGFSFLDQNQDVIQANRVDGVLPSFDAIAERRYPVSRSLYFYVKNAHVSAIPGIREYLAEFTSEKAVGEFGYLSDRGLIPAPEAERRQIRERARQLTPLTLAAGH